MTRLDKKLARIRAGKYSPKDFIIADAKDPDMGPSMTWCGPKREKDGSSTRNRTRQEFLATIRDVVEQDIIDIMLTSVSNLEAMTAMEVFEDSDVKTRRARQRHDRYLGDARRDLCEATVAAVPLGVTFQDQEAHRPRPLLDHLQ